MSDKEKKTVITEYHFIQISVMQFSIKSEENAAGSLITKAACSAIPAARRDSREPIV